MIDISIEKSNAFANLVEVERFIKHLCLADKTELKEIDFHIRLLNDNLEPDDVLDNIEFNNIENNLDYSSDEDPDFLEYWEDEDLEN